MLTDARCKTAPAQARPYKMGDAHGLYLHVKPNGNKTWRMKYRYGGKEKLLTFGPYPLVSLREAREVAADARKLLNAGTDPGLVAKTKAAKRRIATGGTFESIARDWHKSQQEILTDRYAGQVLDRLEADVFPSIGSLAPGSITPALVLALLRSIEARGAIEMAKRVRQHISSVFVFAIGCGLAESDPAAIVRPALKPRLRKLRPAMLQIEQARAMLRTVECQADAFFMTKLASRLLALTAVRPGVLRLAQPDEFEDLEGEEPIWRIPATKMKLTRERKEDTVFEFVVPLSWQAVELVNAAIGAGGGRPYLFFGTRATHRPLTDSTISKFYRTAGYAGRHVPHGWRATFSTIMNQIAAVGNRKEDREVIDLMLAHMSDGVEPIYNRYAYMPRRRELAQEWADILLLDAVPLKELLPSRERAHDGALDRRHRDRLRSSPQRSGPAEQL